MQLVVALKTLLSPWTWFKGGYTQVNGSYTSSPQYLEYDDDPVKNRLMHYNWGGDFDLSVDDEFNRALLVEKMEEIPGQFFKVFKAAGASVIGRPQFELDGWDHFPTEEEVWWAVGEEWGGGTYVIRCQIGNRSSLKVYRFDAPSKVPDVRSAPKSSLTAIKDRIRQAAFERAMDRLDNDPEAAAELDMAVLAKVTGVSVPTTHEESQDDQMLRRHFEEYPEAKEEYAKILIEARKPKEEDAFAEIERVVQMMERLGFKRSGTAGGNGSTLAIFAEVLMEVAKSGQLAKILRDLVTATGATARSGAEAQAQVAELQSQPSESAPVPPSSPPPTEPAQREVASGPSTTEWFNHLLEADPETLARGVHDDPLNFVQECYRLACIDDDDLAGWIIRTVRDNQPDLLQRQIRDQVLPAALGQWRTIGLTVFGQERYDKALDIVQTLASDKGLQWITAARAACVHIEQEMARALSEDGIGQRLNPGRE